MRSLAHHLHCSAGADRHEHGCVASKVGEGKLAPPRSARPAFREHIEPKRLTARPSFTRHHGKEQPEEDGPRNCKLENPVLVPLSGLLDLCIRSILRIPSMKAVYAVAALVAAAEAFHTVPGVIPARFGGSRSAVSSRMVASSPLDMEGEKMSWWDAPRRVVSGDGGMRAKGLYYWLLDEHKVDLSRVELRQSELEGLGCFAKQVNCTPSPCETSPDLQCAQRRTRADQRGVAGHGAWHAIVRCAPLLHHLS